MEENQEKKNKKLGEYIPLGKMKPIFKLFVWLIPVIISIFAYSKSEQANNISNVANNLSQASNVQSIVANNLSKEANNFAREASSISKKANNISKEANNFAREANDISKEARDISKEANDISNKMLTEMKNTREIEFRPVPHIKPVSAGYIGETLKFKYFLLNTGKTRMLNIERCHALNKIDRSQKNNPQEVKPSTCISNKFDKSLNPQTPSLIHNDIVGDYELLENELDEKYFRLDLKVEYQKEELLSGKCTFSRSFNLLPTTNKKVLVVQPLSPLPPNCE